MLIVVVIIDPEIGVCGFQTLMSMPSEKCVVLRIRRKFLI